MKLWLVWVVLLLSLTGCEQPSSMSLAGINQEPRNELENHLVLAVHPYDLPTKVHLHFAPIVEYLSHSLQQPVKLYIATSYEDQIKQIALGKVDLAYLGPSSFVKAYDGFEDKLGRRIQPIATERPYQGAVVVHKDSQVESLSDLKDHTFAFGSYHSYAGHFVIRQALRAQGVTLSDLKLYSFLGRHERAVLSVAYGDFDAAATTSGIAKRMASLNYPIKTIYRSGDLAPIILAAAPGLDSNLVTKLKQVLLTPSFDEQEKMTLFAPGGAYFTFDNQAYETVRDNLATFEQ